jgi:hypothetical protein
MDRYATAMSSNRRRAFRLALASILLIGTVARGSFFLWSQPWTPHHPDEDILPLEALALWEGVTPREVGWPASTTRLALSAAQAIQWTEARSREAWSVRASPENALETITTWIGDRYRHGAGLYKVGRAVSLVTGILQLCVTAWALAAWCGPVGVLVGSLLVAISPVIVVHSQYVLADIAGLLFATIVVGMAANPSSTRVVWMGALAGLAASSKFHFGLWLLTPLLSIWLQTDRSSPSKLRLSLLTSAVAAWVTFTLVPWFLIDPILALKEFAGVVLVKVGPPGSLSRVVANLTFLFRALGTLTWVGSIVAVALLVWRPSRRLAPLWIPTLIGTIAVSVAGVVFDRYVLVVAPGVIVLAASAWETLLLNSRPSLRWAATIGLAICALTTAISLVKVERRAGEVDVDVLVQQWVLSHVPPGKRVALHDEDNARLPRAAEQLQRCIGYVDRPAAWREKWAAEGVNVGENLATPMQAVLLTDERFNAYWCKRELETATDAGYWIVPYHNERRFGAVLERDAIADFQEGGSSLTGGVDVLVVNRSLDVAGPPAQEFRTERGRRFIYVK